MCACIFLGCKKHFCLFCCSVHFARFACPHPSHLKALQNVFEDNNLDADVDVKRTNVLVRCFLLYKVVLVKIRSQKRQINGKRTSNCRWGENINVPIIHMADSTHRKVQGSVHSQWEDSASSQTCRSSALDVQPSIERIKFLSYHTQMRPPFQFRSLIGRDFDPGIIVWFSPDIGFVQNYKKHSSVGLERILT